MNENKMNLNNEYKSYWGKIGYTLFENIKFLNTNGREININYKY